LDFRLLNYCFVASKKGYLEVVKILLENGANIEKHDDRGCTPLMWGKNKK
jgi:ankyrin repeat protein